MEYRAHYESPLGGITMTCDGGALTELRFDTREETPVQDVLPEERFSCAMDFPPEAAAVFMETVRWLDRFFAGEDPGTVGPPEQHRPDEYLADINADIDRCFR